MKKFKIKNPRILIFGATSMALLVAIITASIAWFTSSGTIRVYTNTMELRAADSTSLDLTVPELAAEYERYMGQTGIEYDGVDSPYYVEYSPVIINYSNQEEENHYLTYYFDPETSYLQRGTAGSQPVPFAAEELWDNFVMCMYELTPMQEAGQNVVDEEGNTVYEETGTMYMAENGYFRDVVSGGLLQLEDGDNVFMIRIYFQGDIGYHLLYNTHADIDEQYEFAYSSELYMFAHFRLNAVFNIVDTKLLMLELTNAYDDSYADMDDHYVKLFGNTTSRYEIEGFTGFSQLDAEGNAWTYPVPELYSEDDNSVAHAYYFLDWIYTEQTDTDPVYYIYRDTKQNGTADNVVTLSLRPLRGASERLRSAWGESYVVTLDNYGDGDDYVTEYYVRPKGVYYDGAGYMTYNTATKAIVVVNPSGSTAWNTSSSATVSYSIPAPTREGYRFVGWTLRDDLPDYACNANLSAVPFLFTSTNSYSYNFGASGNGHDVTLYAVWQELGVEVTFVVENSWTHNYATVVGGHVTFGGQNTDFVNNTVTIELPKHTDMTQVTATAVATIGETNRNLTLKYWTRYDSINHSYEKVDNAYDLTEATTFYPIWNERAEYTVTLDVNMYSSAVLYNYGTIAVNTPITIDHYTVTFNDAAGDEYASTGTFSDEDRHDIKVKVLEGMTLADLGLNVEWHRHGSGMGSNSFEGWYSTVGNKENDMATTSWITLNASAVKYNTSTAITANIKLWVRFN